MYNSCYKKVFQVNVKTSPNLLHPTPIQLLKVQGNMATVTEAPSWADQWGAGGFGAMEDDSTRSQNDMSKNKNSGAKGGFSKAKATASNCVKWLKSLCKRKTMPSKQLG
ncbi:hypothetical protein P8452_73135 [Trifolium repens]|nr:hypothetical protein P8452_73135 [Trifolium repens]